ncbi:RraA family protein [Alsobacter sp. SYSU BS001988]
MTTVSDEVLQGLGRLPTGVVADVLLEMGLERSVVCSRLLNLGRSTFIGRAVCATGRTIAPGEQPASAASMFDVDGQVSPGSVVVIDSGDHRHGAVIGGLVALAFKRAGAVGFVTDGGVRDADELADMGLPCVARFVTPRSAKGIWRIDRVGDGISLPAQGGGRVAVGPGDILSADPDGLVVIPAGLALAVLDESGPLKAAEERITAALRSGGDRREAFRVHDRFGHIRKRVE